MVLAESPLGVERSDQLFVDGLTFARATDAVVVDETYDTPVRQADGPRGARPRAHAQLHERAGKRLDVVLRAHDDGVAFRYRFPETDTIAKIGDRRVTGFAVPAGSTAWIAPQQPVGQYAPAYEDLYKEMPSGTPHR